MFDGRKLIIATKHRKEQVIAEKLEKELGVHCVVEPHLDTDLLGTFTGEIERQSDPLITSVKKCQMAMDLTGIDMAIASEGSFGPHPEIGFVPVDEELLTFMDRKNALRISVKKMSTETNFGGSAISSEKELDEFAQKALFPSHALILRAGQDDFRGILKGITDRNELLSHYGHLKREYGSAYVETDMRAMYNPCRMKLIGELTDLLIEKIKSTCPECHKPGFGVTHALPGLKCSLCHFATRSTLCYVKQCEYCHFEDKIYYPHSKTTEDPMYCDICNP